MQVFCRTEWSGRLPVTDLFQLPINLVDASFGKSKERKKAGLDLSG